MGSNPPFTYMKFKLYVQKNGGNQINNLIANH